MKVFYLGVDVSKKKLDLCLRSNGKDILYDVIPNDLSVSTHCMALVYPISQLYLCTELKILFLWTLLIVF
ncbi:Uncharacterised protein [Bacteroides ovatus]|uniref:IS110 family transposase n=1 Tax=Bacteroides ovatus TaxID=28116 RepID=A0A6N2VUA0_BACOV